MTAINYIGKIWWHENIYGLHVHQTQKPKDLKRCCWWQWKRKTQIFSCGGRGGSWLWTPALRMGPITVFLLRPCFPHAVSISELSWGCSEGVGWATPLMGDVCSRTPHSPSQNFLRTVLLSETPTQSCPSLSPSQVLDSAYSSSV